jgi:hypothetical protein
MLLGLLVTEFQEIHKARKEGDLSERYFHGTEAFWNFCDWSSMFLGILSLTGYMWLDSRRNSVVASLASRTAGDEVGYSETLDELSGLIKSKKAS